MTVGTELRAITQNGENNSKWNSVIEAVNAEFSGTLGYAANWDNYQNSNLTNVMWEHPAIDFIGIDSYFQGLLNNSQADASGSYPNPTFIGQVESAWNNKLDSQILPFAAARKAGSGMPVEFTEIGYLPYNRTTVTPQNSSGALDKDEQNMAFEGLMRALDGRLGSGEFLATHIWTWGMPGTGGNLWDMGVSGGEPQANNVQTSQWLSTFVNTILESADFNEDGNVDGNDFLTLQRGLGITSGATLSQGDANNDGAVNHLDLAIWEAQYGTVSTLATVAAVPEPATCWSLLVAGILLLRQRSHWSTA